MTTTLEPLPCGPTAGSEDQAFWDGLNDHRLVLPCCSTCGRWRAPGTITCPECWSFETAWTDVAPTGTVYSWVRSQRDFMSELDVRAPYVTVLVELDDVPIRLLGILLDADVVAIGDRVTGVFQRPANAGWTLLRWERAS